MVPEAPEDLDSLLQIAGIEPCPLVPAASKPFWDDLISVEESVPIQPASEPPPPPEMPPVALTSEEPKRRKAAPEPRAPMGSWTKSLVAKKDDAVPAPTTPKVAPGAAVQALEPDAADDENIRLAIQVSGPTEWHCFLP